MTDQDPQHDPRLAALISDAVSDVEPRDALESIRHETLVNPMSRTSSGRPWIYAVGGAVVATAAVLTAIAFAGDQLGLTSADDHPGPATHRTHAPKASGGADATPTPDATPSESASTDSGGSVTLPVYFVGDTPRGPRLYREFQASTDLGDPLAQAVDLAVTGPALDPDYRSAWPAGTDAIAYHDGGTVTVNIEPADASPGTLRDRPAGMSAQEADMALQQLVYTAQAALQQGRPPVRFMLDGELTDRLLGVATSEPIANGDPSSVLALVNITSPEEGAAVSGSFRASGVANSFEANVPWQIKRGDRVVKSGYSTAEGWMDRLYPWQSDAIDVSGLASGTYTFVAMTDDPSDGEGGGPDVDTRTITVR